MGTKAACRADREDEMEQSKIKLNDALLAEAFKIAGEAGARVALDTIASERDRKRRERYDYRFRNTKLLLRNYRELMAHCQRAVYRVEKGKQKINALEILDNMETSICDEEMYVESIKQSAERTAIIMDHVTEMIGLYDAYCHYSGRMEDQRRYRVIHAMYIADKRMPVREIARLESVDHRTVYKDVDAACEKLSALIFGIDGLRRV